MNLFDNVEKNFRIVKIPPAKNDDNVLQFFLQPDKDCLRLDETYIKCVVYMCSCLIPDSGFFSKMFETLEFTINSIHIGSRGSLYDLQQTSGKNINLYTRCLH